MTLRRFCYTHVPRSHKSEARIGEYILMVRRVYSDTAAGSISRHSFSFAGYRKEAIPRPHGRIPAFANKTLHHKENKMKKHLIRLFLTVLAATVLSLVLASCNHAPAGDTSTTPPQDSTTYTISFVLQGGTAEALSGTTLQVKAQTVLHLADYRPVKEGFTFTGYSDGTTLHAPDAELTVTSDLTLTAVWEEVQAETVTVTLDPAGGTLTETVVTVRKGDTLSLSRFTPVREGYVLSCWQAGDNRLAPDAEITPEADLTLTAVWLIQETDPENFVFTLSEDGRSYVITGLADGFSVADVIVPGYYNGKPVTEIGHSVFAYNNSIRSIDLGRCMALTVIGNWNFNACENLERVSLAGCVSLEKISDVCFSSLPKLTSLDLRSLSNLREIGYACFSYSGIQVTNIPLQTLDFSDCTALTRIGNSCFWYLSELRELDFSNTSLTYVGNQVIKQCPALERISLPATLRYDNIGYEFITDTDRLKEIRVDSLNLSLSVVDGVLYAADQTVLLKFPAAMERTTFTVPSSVRVIAPQAFFSATSLTAVDLSACILQQIGWQAFAGCSGAQIKVSFNRNGRNADGSTVNLGTDWKEGVLSVEFLQVVEITVSGIVDGSTVTDECLTVKAAARYGTETVPLTVTLNGVTVSGSNGVYALNLALGQNTVTFTATHNGKTVTHTIRITRKAGAPTVETTLKDGTLSWYGGTVDFTVTARDVAGNPLPASALEIRYNFGFGSFRQKEGVTLTDNGDGTFRVSVSYDYYKDRFYLEKNTFIALTVVVKDGDLSSSATCTVDWRLEAPSLSVSTTLENGAEATYGSPLQFTVTAKGTDGTALTAAALTLHYNFGFGNYDLAGYAFTMTDNGDGTVSVTVDFSQYAMMGFFDWEDKDDIHLLLVVQDGAVQKTLEYTVKWVEG